MGKLAGGAGLALGAGLAVEAGRAVVAFEETRKVGAQTNAVLKSTGGAAKVSAAAVADLATAISNKTGIDDEAIQSTENMLLTFTKLRNETGKGNDIFTQATKIATDMSVALGQDGTKSAIQLGKALNDPIKGVTALSRVGVTFTQGQKDQIKTLESTGHHLAAQKLILRELNKEFRGSAQAQATPLQKAKVAAGNLEEALGKGLSPAVDTVLTKFTNLARKVEPALNRVTKQISRTFNRKDLDLGDKVTISWAMVQRKLAPFGRQFMAALNNAHLGDKLSRAFEAAAPKIADAMASAAPRAAGAFVNAFKKAGPWGKLITVAFLAQRLGAFSAVGGWAAGQFTGALKKRMGRTMPGAGTAAGTAYSGAFAATSSAEITAAGARGGKLGRATTRMGRAAGRIGGLAMAAGFAYAFGPELVKLIPQEFKKSEGALLGKISDILKGLFDKLAAPFKGGKGGYKDSLKKLQDATGLTLGGDGLGKIADGLIGAGGVLPSGGAFGGSLMGARPSLKPFAAIGSRFGLNVVSGKRAGDITKTGNISYHSSGEAIDMGDGRGPDRNKLAFAKYMKSHFGHRLAELIYTPMDGGVGIWNGQPHRFSPVVAKDHYDHVHVAFDTGRPGVGDGPGKGDGYGYKELGNLWIRAGGPVRAANTAAAVALAESGGDTNARNGPYHGLWQIGPGGPFGAMANARAAVAKWRANRWQPWEAYTGPDGRGSDGPWRRFLRNVDFSAATARRGGSGGGGRVPVARIRPTSGRAVNVGPNTSAGTGNIGPQGLGTGKRTDEQAAENQRQAGLAGPNDMLGYEGTLGQIGVEQAQAKSSGNVKAMIRALYEEAFAKRQRLRRVNQLLRRRLKRATRRALNDEKVQLLDDLKSIGELFKEYSENGMGPDGSPNAAPDVEAPATASDFADLAIAEAALTPGTADDIAATEGLLGIRAGELAAARATGDPRKILDALNAWTAVKESLDALRAAVDTETDTRQRLIDSNLELIAEFKKSNEYASTLTAVGYREALKALADQMSGQIYGPTNNRRQTAGTGARVRIP